MRGFLELEVLCQLSSWYSFHELEVLCQLSSCRKTTKGGDTGVNNEMTRTVYVPNCFANECKIWLEQLKKDLDEHGFHTKCEQDLPACGIYYSHYKEQSTKCSYTILHKCLQLWKKIKHRESLETWSQNHQRQRCFCLRFCTKQRYTSAWDLTTNEFETYFDNFQIKDIREFIDLSHFVGSLSSHSDREGQQEVQPHGGSSTFRRNDRFYTQTVCERSIVKQIQQLRDEMVQGQDNIHDVQVISENGSHHHHLYIKKMDCLEESKHLLNLNTIEDLQGMKNKLDKLMKNAEAARVNISFIKHKVLPFLLDNMLTAAVVTMATVENEEIQKEAVNTLELLAFTGKLSAQYLDLSTLEKIMGNLLESVIGDKRTKSVQHLLLRKVGIFLMLEEEMVFRCKDKLDLSVAEEFNKRSFQIQKSMLSIS
ncbi:hypothetical protein Btru_057119 [Bulinus truncatus]|nr:hypothetical protein Btru_057119 [Bulinus truncatus]